MNFDAAQIAAATGGQVRANAAAGPIVTDTRALRPGDWFLALVGERFDGHAFVAEAARAGVAGVVVGRDVEVDGVGVVRVRDTLQALQDLGRASRARLTGPVVGITGSAGKTTTRALTALALAPLGDVHQTGANLNNHIGVPLTLVGAPERAAASVIEMGTSGPGEIALLADIGRPDVRLIVNVGPAHLEELGGLDGVAREKGCMFKFAAPGDTLCVNLDDPRVVAAPRPLRTRMIGYGRSADATIRLAEAVVDPDSLRTRATFATPEGEVTVVLPVPGVHIAHNAAGALAVALACGVRLEDAAAALARYEPVGMRMRVERLEPGITVFNDAYNANPSSMEASLQVLASLPGRRIAVLGDMLELGPDEARWHDQVAHAAGELALDVVVLTGPRMSKAAAACVGARLVLAEPDPERVAAKLRALLREGDRVLFKGSRGARVERVLAALQGVAAEGH